MRITIEPTHQGVGGKHPNPKVIVELPSDDYSIDEVLENLIGPALRAFGYVFDEDHITL
jgi:hypothetical protein